MGALPWDSWLWNAWVALVCSAHVPLTSFASVQALSKVLVQAPPSLAKPWLLEWPLQFSNSCYRSNSFAIGLFIIIVGYIRWLCNMLHFRNFEDIFVFAGLLALALAFGVLVVDGEGGLVLSISFIIINGEIGLIFIPQCCDQSLTCTVFSIKN